jgi:NADH:ubiquinone oxidoreductase subunit
LDKALLSLAPKQAAWRKFYIEQKDQALGRERVGVDRYGNKYYQYFSYHGLPTKRIVLY